MSSINYNKKRIYTEPLIERIKLDAEISLALESDPPTYETSNIFCVPEYFNSNPIQNNVV